MPPTKIGQQSQHVFEVAPSKILDRLGDALFLELARTDSFFCHIKDSDLWVKALTGTTGLLPAAAVTLDRDLHDDALTV
jgi:hypothetical protein